MHDPRKISIRDYQYELPDDRIARYPLERRDDSRLLIYEQGQIREDIYRHIATHIPSGYSLVFNDTRVVEARLLFQKPTGGIIEIFCIEPHEQYADISTAMLQQGTVLWQCMIGGASKWKHGQLLEKSMKAEAGSAEGSLHLRARLIEKRPDLFVIEFSWAPSHLSFAELLHLAGVTPLPPYLKRDAEKSDAERYQTVYAKTEGSVAAPTAGLHFTEQTLQSLKEKKILTEYLTLHVGAGTFKPVKASTMDGHPMHSEWIDVRRSTIAHLLENSAQLIAVGTTSLRTLESLYWLGIHCRRDQTAANETPVVGQWDPYDLDGETDTATALQDLLTWMDKRKMDRLITRTQLLIAPGYRFRLVKGLITNFHQPESTLLLLVAALIGEDWRKVYQYALEKGFRFLSYGDGSLLWGKEEQLAVGR